MLTTTTHKKPYGLEGDSSSSSSSSNESMPCNVSESDYHASYKNFLTIGQVKSSLDNRSTSKLSSSFSAERIAEQPANGVKQDTASCLENLSDENEEL